MYEDLLTSRLESMLGDVVSLIAERAEGEKRIEEEYQKDCKAAEERFQVQKEQIETTYQEDRKATEVEYRQARRHLKEKFESDYGHTKRQFETAKSRIEEKAAHNDTTATKQLQEGTWVAETVFEAGENQANETFDQTTEHAAEVEKELLAIREQLSQYVRKFRVRRPTTAAPSSETAEEPEADEPKPEAEEPETAERATEERETEEPGNEEPGDDEPNLKAYLTVADERLLKLKQAFLPRLFEGFWPWVLGFVIVAVGFIAWLSAHQWVVDETAFAGGGIALGGTLVILALLFVVARSQTARAGSALNNAVTEAQDACDVLAHRAEKIRDERIDRLLDQRNEEVAKARQRFDSIMEKVNERRGFHLHRLDGESPEALAEIEKQRDEDAQAVSDRRENRSAEIQHVYESDTAALQEQHERQTHERTERYHTDWNNLEHRWKRGMDDAYSTVERIESDRHHLFPPWDDKAWDSWTPPYRFSPVVQCGSLHVDLTKIPGGLPTDERLIVKGPVEFDVPATISFPDRCSLLIEAGAEGRDQAVQTLETVMLRLLTTLPPGKVRFTILDPVGLGQSFAGFMHLADYDDQFVGARIWTEARHIEQRLTDLTDHMEKVIQKYLRNEFETIGEYNEEAGEIAEPFRFLVISDFPVNVSDGAMRRLSSIVTSGARCGVYTLIYRDTRHGLPKGFDPSEIRKRSAHLVHDPQADRFVWKNDVFERFPLTLEQPAEPDFVTRTLKVVGRAAKDASRVEVPFDAVAPKNADELWSLNSSDEIRVPLGRAGATKLQYLSLGLGTAQHALVAGKTGSGKSTLLHVLITNLALWYSPDEVEFYLVDFKKGVEFKTYATHALPHARAVAVESDREFALSVLQRVDQELKRRGNIYRNLGVQNLAGYRQSGETEPMPRTLLIIDEFQEFFVEDDKLAQEASLLLDRLVRQGRAFGIHVLLGSQTLGGAYSLARSTIGQMAVRVALQCSEQDSYLILNEDNAAARLLSRPGEALYNDASGMVEGNNPFQIVWLPESIRERHLQRAEDLARQQQYQPAEPTIVFEGNVPAEIERNHELNGLLENGSPADTTASCAWLGEAIAIKGPTAPTFRRQSGSNLLFVGQQHESALAMMATSFASLAAGHAVGDAVFYLMDGSPVDSPFIGYLDRLADYVPHETHVVHYRDVPDVIEKLNSEVDRREQTQVVDGTSVYLLIYGLQRYRKLRQDEELSFSMSESDKPEGTDKQFSEILRDGASVGVHTIIWCDTLSNVNRTFDRQGLREFELRVLFQMSTTDSSNLIDSPQAAKLGMRRALFACEEEGTIEKFRPYALPDEGWLESVRERLTKLTTAPSEAG